MARTLQTALRLLQRPAASVREDSGDRGVSSEHRHPSVDAAPARRRSRSRRRFRVGDIRRSQQELYKIHDRQEASIFVNYRPVEGHWVALLPPDIFGPQPTFAVLHAQRLRRLEERNCDLHRYFELDSERLAAEEQARQQEEADTIDWDITPLLALPLQPGWKIASSSYRSPIHRQ